MDGETGTELSIADLGNEIERYELAAALSAEEFDDYYTKEVELESRLLAFANQHVAELEFDNARGLMEQVVSLNQQMRTIAQRQLDRLTGDEPDFREQLTSALDGATGLMILTQGQIHQNHAEGHMLSGRLQDARDRLEAAASCYSDLASGAPPQSIIGDVARASMITRIEFVDGMAAMQRGRYESAKEFFEEAYSKYGLMDDELAMDPDDVNDRFIGPIEEFRREFAEQSTYTNIMIKYLEFFCQIQAGNYEDAIAYMTDAVTLYEAWLNRAIAAKLPNRVLQVRRMELEYFRGWQAWGRAEYAVETREWGECRDHLREARTHWFTSSDMARRHALLGLMNPQFQTANAEMLMRGTLRRRASEKRLYEQINRLQEENRQIRAYNINQYSGGTVMHDQHKINIGGDATGPIVSGDNAKVKVGDITTTKTTASLEELRALADELADLRDNLEAGAASDSQRASVKEVELAEQQARVGDETGVRAHLKAAGRWTLAAAQRLTLTAAEAAIKASLGT